MALVNGATCIIRTRTNSSKFFFSENWSDFEIISQRYPFCNHFENCSQNFDQSRNNASGIGLLALYRHEKNSLKFFFQSFITETYGPPKNSGEGSRLLLPSCFIFIHGRCIMKTTLCEVRLGLTVCVKGILHKIQPLVSQTSFHRKWDLIQPYREITVLTYRLVWRAP